MTHDHPHPAPRRDRAAFTRLARPLVLAASLFAAPLSVRAQSLAAVYPDNARLQPVFESAFTQRVAFVGIGDSNQLFNTTGWEYGWFDALQHRYSIWGTALISAGEDYGYSSSIGTGAGVQAAAPTNDGSFVFAGAPLPFEAVLSSISPVAPAGFLYIPWYAAEQTSITPHGLILTGAAGLNLNEHLRFHFTHALFFNGRTLNAHVSDAASGGSWLGPVLTQSAFSTDRPDEPPPNPLASNPPAAFDPAPVATHSIDLPAGPRSWNLRLWFGDELGRARGPFFLTYMQAEMPARTSGFAVHTLYGLGGASARDMAGTIAAASDAQLTTFFERVRAPLGPNPRVIVRINTGLNDRSEWMPSIQSGITPGSLPEAVRENIDAITARVRSIWAINNWDAGSELHFLLSISHPLSNPDDPWLESYRFALRTLADRFPDVTLVDIPALAHADEIAGKGWYNLPEDRFHLNPSGYTELARRELRALIRRPCFEPADLDDSGRVTTRDLITLLEDYARPGLTLGQGGDLDRDADCDTNDLILLLSRFGTSTCNAQPPG